MLRREMLVYHYFATVYGCQSIELLRWTEVFLTNASPPSVLGRNVVIRRRGLTLLSIPILSKRTSRSDIIIPEQPALTELRNQKLDHIYKSSWFDRVGDIETIYVCLVDPTLKFVCDLSRRANSAGA